ncbi:periplasmic nitrate reductase, NapE protein [Azospirillum isscasi]|uniref:Periplasmic nitrate reductase, NapE protein n=1 Tax=Azospirillum isscasi TaxID=3053926 RepID=A0ABU0WKI5_9PROT|nr:periplasmic nitrate reductase, NapE protein [Azospirillum isscasi]MDQ2104730.1 periplasmic nitrate reductase, NapE protein [Azospirillum isscasi]
MSRLQSRDSQREPTRFPSRAAAGAALPDSARPDSGAKRREIAMFLLLAVVIWPILSIAVVGGYGFLIWMSQLIMGPPGPPPV